MVVSIVIVPLTPAPTDETLATARQSTAWFSAMAGTAVSKSKRSRSEGSCVMFTSSFTVSIVRMKPALSCARIARDIGDV